MIFAQPHREIQILTAWMSDTAQIRYRYGVPRSDDRREGKLIQNGRKTLGKLGGNDWMSPDNLRTTLGWSTGPDAVPGRKPRSSFFGKFITMLQVVPLLI